MRELLTMAKNVTRQFEPQGECDSSYPTLDGSCRNENDDGRSMATYKRLVPANYCDQKQYPRCRQGNFSGSLIISIVNLTVNVKFQFFKNTLS